MIGGIAGVLLVWMRCIAGSSVSMAVSVVAGLVVTGLVVTGLVD